MLRLGKDVAAPAAPLDSARGRSLRPSAAEALVGRTYGSAEIYPQSAALRPITSRLISDVMGVAFLPQSQEREQGNARSQKSEVRSQKSEGTERFVATETSERTEGTEGTE